MDKSSLRENERTRKQITKISKVDKIPPCFFFFILIKWKYKQNYQKEVEKKMITLQDINAIFRHLKKILHMLDKIYHAMELDKEEE